MFLAFMTFLVTSALYGVLMWLACRRVSRHLQGNAEGIKAVTDHVLIPLLGRPIEGQDGQGAAGNSEALLAEQQNANSHTTARHSQR